jgi:hypothetical protein
MKQTIILMAISMLVRVLTPELIKEGWEFVKARVETYVKESENTLDDFLYSAIHGGADDLKVIADFVLDFVRDFVLGTPSKIDDAVVLPICSMIRDAFNIPDEQVPN